MCSRRAPGYSTDVTRQIKPYYLLSNKPVWRSNKNLLDATEKNAEMKAKLFCRQIRIICAVVSSNTTAQIASCYKTTTRKTQRIMSRTERRGGDICSHYLNSFVGVNSIETLLLICINTHLPDTQKHVEQPVIHVFVLRFSEKQEFYPLLQHAALSTPKMEIAEFRQVAYKSYR